MSPATLPDPERLKRARAYRVFTRILGLTSQGASVLLMLALYTSGISARLRDAFGVGPGPVRDYLVVAGLLAIAWLVDLPFAYLSYRRARAEGLLVQSLMSASVDRMKVLGLSVSLVGLPTAAWYAVLPREDWWILSAAGALAFAALSMALGAVLLALFYRLSPLEDGALVERLTRLGERTGVRVAGVYRWGLSAKSTGANAAVVGLGPTKRIVIADTMLEDPLPEVEAVLAHELAHQVHGDTVRFFVLFGAGLAAFLLGLRIAIDSLTGGHAVDVATYPLLVAGFGLAGFIFRPLVMRYSRSREYAADVFAARLTSPTALVSALVRLVDRNLSDPEPPAWEEALFMSHPSLRNRMSAVGQRWPPLPPPSV